MTDCICTDNCPESDNPCNHCRQLDPYDPCPVTGYGCGATGYARCDCCTDDQWNATQ